MLNYVEVVFKTTADIWTCPSILYYSQFKKVCKTLINLTYFQRVNIVLFSGAHHSSTFHRLLWLLAEMLSEVKWPLFSYVADSATSHLVFIYVYCMYASEKVS